MSHPCGPLRVALVHDWLTGQRGGEQVLLALCNMFPEAPVYTLVHIPGSVHSGIEAHPIVTSAIQIGVRKNGGFRHLLPLFASAIEAFDFSNFDVVISSSHCVAHGVLTPPSTLHVAYVHSPMRYLYDQLPHYLPPVGRAISAPIARFFSTPLRRWDRRAAQRADLLVANSHYVAARIARVWGRQASVVHPPTAVHTFRAPPPGSQRRGLLWVGALVPYKRVDLAVQVSAAAGVPLTIVGQGPQEASLRAMAGRDVRFVRRVSHEELNGLYGSHEALIYCGEEDFGITPVEAMAAGCPVLGLDCGGLKETVKIWERSGPDATGVLVAQATSEAFVRGLVQLRARIQAGWLSQPVLARHAQTFGASVFASKLGDLVRKQWALRHLA